MLKCWMPLIAFYCSLRETIKVLYVLCTVRLWVLVNKVMYVSGFLSAEIRQSNVRIIWWTGGWRPLAVYLDIPQNLWRTLSIM
jgi:hypothetical protein